MDSSLPSAIIKPSFNGLLHAIQLDPGRQRHCETNECGGRGFDSGFTRCQYAKHMSSAMCCLTSGTILCQPRAVKRVSSAGNWDMHGLVSEAWLL